MHDWIDGLCDVLDIDVEIDEALVLDLAREAAHNVERLAAPITTYLLGYAAALHDADPDTIEELAGKAMALAERFGGEEVSADDFEDATDELVDVD